ncbi:MAG: hypothetical protein GX316_04340 [Firmicutes bacterium]|nr:hypothetical protein [Bacillota bacterium]
MGKRIGRLLQDIRVTSVVTILLFLLFHNQPHWAGLWLGLTVGLINWQGLSNAAHRAVRLSVSDAQRYMVRSYVIRYGMRFAVLAIGFIFYDLNPLTLIVGLTLPTLVAVIIYKIQLKK